MRVGPGDKMPGIAKLNELAPRIEQLLVSLLQHYQVDGCAAARYPLMCRYGYDDADGGNDYGPGLNPEAIALSLFGCESRSYGTLAAPAL